MKEFKLFTLAIIFIFIIKNIPAKELSEVEKTNYYDNSFLTKPEHCLFNEDDLYELITLTVPDKYIDAFMYYSEFDDEAKTQTIRIYLLGIGRHESGWVKIKSDGKNLDGTYDWGYLMLNEGNIRSKRFMRLFGPKEELKAQDDIELWLITCVRYFIYLYDLYGCDALYAYNAGERAYLSNAIPDGSYRYKYSVKEHTLDVLTQLYSIAESNRIKRSRDKFEREIELFEKEKNMWKNMSKKLEQEFSPFYTCPMSFSLIDTVELLYDPRKRFINKIILRRFILLSVITNDKRIANAL
jgi:hypothetical protein